jgi:hypothetical protein
VEAVLNRPYIGAGEARRMLIVQNIVRWHREKHATENWAKWASENEEQENLLNIARDLAEQEGYLDD